MKLLLLFYFFKRKVGHCFYAMYDERASDVVYAWDGHGNTHSSKIHSLKERSKPNSKLTGLMSKPNTKLKWLTLFFEIDGEPWPMTSPIVKRTMELIIRCHNGPIGLSFVYLLAAAIFGELLCIAH